MRVCNSLPATANTINSSFDYNTTYFPFGVSARPSNMPCMQRSCLLYAGDLSDAPERPCKCCARHSSVL